MSNQITTDSNVTSLLAEVCGGAQPQVEMMIGIGLVKDSEAVFFQYLGDDRVPPGSHDAFWQARHPYGERHSDWCQHC